MRDVIFKRTILTIVLTTFLCVSVQSIAAIEKDANQVNFLILSDVHTNFSDPKPDEKPVNINPHPPETRGANLDKETFLTLIHKLGEKLPNFRKKPDFIMELGDSPKHNANLDKNTMLYGIFDTFYKEFKDREYQDIPLFYTFGNNDSLEKNEQGTYQNYGIFRYDGESTYEIFKQITGKGGFLTTGEECPWQGKPCVAAKNEGYGYYSAYIGDHLKLISLNSVIYVEKPTPPFPSRDGDYEQLDWLRTQLEKSRDNNEQVILAMHVGPNLWESRYQDILKEVLNSEANPVIGMFVSHTHMDELRVIISNERSIPIIFGPGLSTDHDNASAFKTVSINRKPNKPWAIKNYTTWYFKGQEARESTIEKFYDFKRAFCVSGQPSFIDCLNGMIEKTEEGKYIFNDQASLLLKEHYFANPAMKNGTPDTSEWILDYRG